MVEPERVQRWLAAHPGVAVWEETERQLIDAYSGKRLPFDLGRFERLEEKENRELGGTYLVLLRDDGRQLVLAEPGIAWEPGTQSTGPLDFLPPVVCWRDFSRLLAEAAHRIRAHPEVAPDRGLLDLIMVCIALLEGARALGFETGAEEREVDSLLTELERRRRG
ncbi:MAG: hypothetical protein D6729_10365 [Deltaproteobacteria bacterium]|nr:MAG: hypothetical protein D6729_10365 [Deltaproteobacteria bacterium]